MTFPFNERTYVTVKRFLKFVCYLSILFIEQFNNFIIFEGEKDLRNMTPLNKGFFFHFQIYTQEK